MSESNDSIFQTNINNPTDSIDMYANERQDVKSPTINQDYFSFQLNDSLQNFDIHEIPIADRYQHLNEKYNSAKKIIKFLLSQNNSLNQKKKNNENHFQSTIDNLKMQNSKLENENHEIKSNINEFYDEFMESHNNTKEDLYSKNSFIKRKKYAIDEIQRLSDCIFRLDFKIENQKHEIIQLKQEKSSLQQQINNYKLESQFHSNELKKLNLENNLLKADVLKLNSLKKENESLSQQINMLKMQIISLTGNNCSEKDSYQDKTKVDEEYIEKLQNENKTLQKQLMLAQIERDLLLNGDKLSRIRQLRTIIEENSRLRSIIQSAPSSPSKPAIIPSKTSIVNSVGKESYSKSTLIPLQNPQNEITKLTKMEFSSSSGFGEEEQEFFSEEIQEFFSEEEQRLFSEEEQRLFSEEEQGLFSEEEQLI